MWGEAQFSDRGDRVGDDAILRDEGERMNRWFDSKEGKLRFEVAREHTQMAMFHRQPDQLFAQSLCKYLLTPH